MAISKITVDKNKKNKDKLAIASIFYDYSFFLYIKAPKLFVQFKTHTH